MSNPSDTCTDEVGKRETVVREASHNDSDYDAEFEGLTPSQWPFGS